MPTSYAQGWKERFDDARRIKAIHLRMDRVTNGMLAEAVAKRLKLKSAHTQQAASRWVNGTSIPPAEVAMALADYLGVDPGWLICGAASAAPEPAELAALRSINLTPMVEEHRRRQSAATVSPREKPRARPRK